MIRELLAASKGQFVRCAPREQLRDVEPGLSVVALRRKIILNYGTSARSVLYAEPAARVVERLRPRVGDQRLQPIRKPPLELRLERMIVGDTDALRKAQCRSHERHQPLCINY